MNVDLIKSDAIHLFILLSDHYIIWIHWHSVSKEGNLLAVMSQENKQRGIVKRNYVVYMHVALVDYIHTVLDLDLKMVLNLLIIYN